MNNGVTVKECAENAKEILLDENNDLCEYINSKIYDIVSETSDLFVSKQSVQDWAEEYQLCSELRKLSDDNLCAINTEDIDSVNIVENDNEYTVTFNEDITVILSK